MGVVVVVYVWLAEVCCGSSQGGRLRRSSRVAFWCVWSFLRCVSYMSVGLVRLVKEVKQSGIGSRCSWLCWYYKGAAQCAV